MDVFEGERLRLARLFHALSQEELGATIATSRQFIHQLECGARQPPADALAALAFRLSVTPDFLRRPVQQRVQQEQTHFRKRRTTAAGVAEQVLAFGTLFEELVALVTEWVELPPVRFPGIDADGSRAIEDAAAHCRRIWGLRPNAPIENMTRVLEAAGAVVTTFPGISERVDALSIARARPIVVRNTAKGNPPRQRFDLAHECGHLVLHQGRETGDPAREAEADRFAAAFLMPREAFAAEVDVATARGTLRWSALYALKQRWKVSVRAIVYRAHALGVLDPMQYRRANVYLNRTGQTKHEVGDDGVPEEEPEVLGDALRVLRDELGVSFQDLAARLGVTPELLGRLSGLPGLPETAPPGVRNPGLRR